MSIFQILIVLILAFIVIKTIYRFIKKDFSFWLFILMISFWLIICLLVIYPEILSYLSSNLGIGRGTDLAVYLAILAIIYLIFKYNVRISHLEKKITQIVRNNALKNAKNPQYEQNRDNSRQL